jgi:hypothetical protein
MTKMIMTMVSAAVLCSCANDPETAARWQAAAMAAAAGLQAGVAAHQAQQPDTVIIHPAPSFQIPSWQPSVAPDPWHGGQQYQPPKTYISRPSPWGGWITTES